MDEVFLDTSIQIARFVHSETKKGKIEDRIKTFSASTTSIIVKQEFKRRLLKEAAYLLGLLNEKKSIWSVLRHVSEVLPPQQYRKQRISLAVINTLFDSSTDKENAEHAMRYLRTLLVCGLADFEDLVDSIIEDSGCHCSRFDVREKTRYVKYDFGPEKCSKVREDCKIKDFLDTKLYELRKIQALLNTLPVNEKSKELQQSEKFIEEILLNLQTSISNEPCYKHGDLMIALESIGVTNFYTMNSAESQHLCRALSQNLYVRPNNDEKEDVVCLNSEATWPKL